jgi:hypothetical protein
VVVLIPSAFLGKGVCEYYFLDQARKCLVYLYYKMFEIGIKRKKKRA